MSIYYNHNQNSRQSPPKHHQQPEPEWEDIAIVHKKPRSPSPPPKIEENPHKQKLAKKKSLGIKEKLGLIVNFLEEENSVAEMTHYREPSENQDELAHSTSTLQSNERRKYKKIPRKQESNQKNMNIDRQGNKAGKNRRLDGQNQVEKDELALQQKPKKESNSRPKYLFYNIVKEQNKDKPIHKQETKPLEPNVNRSPKRRHNQLRKEEHDYQYEKGVYLPDQKKKQRLKSKLGRIFDLFHQDEEVASVSYYSQSQKESIEVKPKQTDSPHKVKEEQHPPQNIFEPQRAEEADFIGQQKKKQTKHAEHPITKSNQFQNINLPISPVQKIQQPVRTPPELSKQTPSNDSVFRKIKKSIKINNSLERIELELNQMNHHRSKSKLSVTKSVQNKPKAQRYDNREYEQDFPKKKSVDLSDLSRHIKQSVNRDPSSKPSNHPHAQLSKSKSASSKVSIKLMEIEIKKSSEKQPSSIHKKQPQKTGKLQEAFADEETAKKVFPIARKVSLPKNNSNFSKYMKIDFKDNSSGHQQEANEEQIPTVFIKKTDSIQRTLPKYTQQKDTVKINTNTNTGGETSKISFKPINKVQFSIDRAKRFKTEFIPQKDELSEQEKRFLALLRKREEALLKRVKEQVLNNNPSIILKENYEQRSKELSNDAFEKIITKEDTTSNKSPTNYYKAERRDKMSLKSEKVEQTELKPFFPTLNLSPSAKQPNFQTFYNNPLFKRSNSKNVNYISAKKKGLSEHLSSDSQRGKTIEDRFDQARNFRKQPSKISYYNIKKLHRESSMNERNLNSKEKYERLKQLLEQI